MREHFIRHGDILTHSAWTDPVYLTEPFIKSEDYVQERPGGNWLWPCEYVEELADRATEVPS